MGAGSPALRLAAVLALLLAMWAVQPSSAQSPSAPAPPEAKDDLTITDDEIEQRARLLGLSDDAREQLNELVKETFRQLIMAKSTQDRLRELQEEVIRSNPGKAREELIAILHERQKDLGAALSKQAVESARAALLSKFRAEAKQQLMDERRKLKK